MSDWTVDTQSVPDTAVFAGILRLESVAAYQTVLATVRDAMSRASGTYTIDFRELVLLNSSGIRAFGVLVIEAREAGRPLTILGRSSVPWQRKTLATLGALYDGATVRLE